MNLENHEEMLLEPSAKMDSPSSDKHLLVWTPPHPPPPTPPKKRYEQTHMMQVWTTKLNELQLPVQNPAREGACTSMSY